MRPQLKRKFNFPKIPQDPFTRALKYLSYRPRSFKEIFDYLKKKEYPEDQIQKTLEKLKEYAFINDEEFAQQFAISHQRKGKSKLLISMELTQKGISREGARKVLGEIKSDIDSASEYIQKRLRQFERYTFEEKNKKIAGRLRMRGYNWDTISEVLKKIKK